MAISLSYINPLAAAIHLARNLHRAVPDATKGTGLAPFATHTDTDRQAARQSVCNHGLML